MDGKLLVFEGPDGVGKTTLVQGICALLQDSGIPFISLSFPGKTVGTLGHLIDRVHHSPTELGCAETTPLALQALHVAAHLDTIESRILPALHDGTNIILDRTWWSTLVYGKVAGVNDIVLEKLIEAEKLCWGRVTPSVIFLVKRSTAFRAEHSGKIFSELSRLYDELAALEERSHPVVRIFNDDLQASITSIQQSVSSIFGTPLSAAHDG